jgi:transcriptional regulator with GAF, ATPase, and Fis domain
MTKDAPEGETLGDSPVRSAGARVLLVRWTAGDAVQSARVTSPLLVGSAADVAVRIDDRRVSRLHAEIAAAPGGLLVRDLGSKNGIYAGDIRIERAVLPAGARFRIGETELEVSFEAAPAAGEPAAPAKRSFHGLVGQSDVMRALFALLERVSASDAPALVTGETGTGKELVARAIHDASPRSAAPFVVVDCAALPEALLEAELFGHAKGAFTGAATARAGAFEAAQGGTIFLDEIGELPPSMQPKLLRALESRTVRRLGETSHRNIDVRFVAATHRDLPSMVTRGSFREDLYFRIAVLPLRVPPLRERPEDVPVLLAHFEKRLGHKLPFGPSERARLAGYAWPGNVREVRNLADRALALGGAMALAAIGLGADAAPVVQAASPVDAAEPAAREAAAELPELRGAYRSFRDDWARTGDLRYVHALIERPGGDVALAAAEAQIDKSYFYRLVKRTSG